MPFWVPVIWNLYGGAWSGRTCLRVLPQRAKCITLGQERECVSFEKLHGS